MISTTLRIAIERQDALRAEAENRRLLATTSEPKVGGRFAAIATVIRSAFGGFDVAPGSVFPATH